LLSCIKIRINVARSQSWIRGRKGLGLFVLGRDAQVPKPSQKLITFSCIGAECHISLDDLRIVPLLRLVVEKPACGVSKQRLVTRRRTCRKADWTYLLSPFEGRPMTSRGSTLTAFNRLHAPGVERPPRASIWEIRVSSVAWGWIGKLVGVDAGTAGACEDEESSRLSKARHRGRPFQTAPQSSTNFLLDCLLI
jgi:hypothetical protein